MKVNVIKDKCIGCGNCVSLTESLVFDFNDDGLAETITNEISKEMKESVKDAIKQCPTEAIIEVDETEENE